MNKLPSEETVKRLREQYPAGTRIELVSMDDPYSKLKPGDKGSVDFIDDTGTIFCKWDNGSGLGLVYGADQYRKIEPEIEKDATYKGAENAPQYATGADFFRDTAVTHGRDEAHIICGNYLAAQLRIDLPKGEEQFCRELFAALYEDTTKAVDAAKLVYPHDFKTADDRDEAPLYHSSRNLNRECAEAMHKAINESCYKVNFYNLELAAMKIVHDYGFERVNAVLAKVIGSADYDGRYSNTNKKWAKAQDIQSPAFDQVYMNTHPTLIDSFAEHARALYDELGAERHALPGIQESGVINCGYEIVRSIQFNNNRGFAIGLNPSAPAQFVCWQTTTENGARHYYWGTYSVEFATAALKYTTRIMSYLEGTELREVRQAQSIQKSTGQNRNMIDGIPNNRQPASDKEDKPSVMKEIREARSAPEQPKPNKGQELGDKPKKKEHYEH